MTGSALYDVTIVHARAEPRHRVRFRARYAHVDLDDWPAAVAARRHWSTHPLAPVRLRRADYLDGTERPWRAALDDLVASRLGRRPPGPVHALTQLRTAGWLLNPLTTYFCLAADRRALDAVVLEITNTPWHQRHWYVVDGDHLDGRPWPKELHVSPFLPMDLTYRLRTAVPGDRLTLGLTAHDAAGRTVFGASVDGTRRPLDAPVRPLAAAQTVAVSAGIYAHAVALRAAGATFHRHPDGARPRRRVRAAADDRRAVDGAPR